MSLKLVPHYESLYTWVNPRKTHHIQVIIMLAKDGDCDCDGDTCDGCMFKQGSWCRLHELQSVLFPRVWIRSKCSKSRTNFAKGFARWCMRKQEVHAAIFEVLL